MKLYFIIIIILFIILINFDNNYYKLFIRRLINKNKPLKIQTKIHKKSKIYINDIITENEIKNYNKYDKYYNLYDNKNIQPIQLIQTRKKNN